MSLTIFWIALFPTITIFMVASVTHNKLYITLTAIVVALIGAVSGSPEYATTDILFAVVVWLFCISGAEKIPKKLSSNEAAKVNSGGMNWVNIFIVIALFLVMILPSIKEDAAKQAAALPVAPTVAPIEQAKPIKKPTHTHTKKQSSPTNLSDQEASEREFAKDFPEDIYQ